MCSTCVTSQPAKGLAKHRVDFVKSTTHKTTVGGPTRKTCCMRHIRARAVARIRSGRGSASGAIGRPAHTWAILRGFLPGVATVCFRGTAGWVAAVCGQVCSGLRVGDFRHAADGWVGGWIQRTNERPDRGGCRAQTSGCWVDECDGAKHFLPSCWLELKLGFKL